MATTFAEISNEKYLLLTTFTKDGRPKPTPIWAAPDGDGRLLVMTDDDAWKVKRIRNNPRVTLAACTMRGKPTSDPVDAVAAVLDKSETPNVIRAVVKRYGLIGRMFHIYNGIRGGSEKTIGLELRPAPA